MKLKEDFVSRINKLLGSEYRQFLDSLDEPAPVSVRKNPLKPGVVPSGTPVPWCTEGIFLPERPVFTLDPLFHGGAYYVQEASSMFLHQVLREFVTDPAPLCALDLCAAPGGKSTLISSVIPPGSLLVCNEVNRQRASVLSENVQKWGAANTIVTRNDPASFAMLPDFFDLILVDAPCSGEGMFRKDPGAVAEWSLSNVINCAGRQKNILGEAWNALRPGGILIYSTCTYNLEENEEVVEWCMENLDAENPAIEAGGFPGIMPSFSEKVKAARFFPHRVKGEGLFMAVLKKKEGYSKSPSFRKKILQPLPKNSPRGFAVTGNRQVLQWGNQVISLPEGSEEKVNSLLNVLYPVFCCLHSGEIKGNDLIPAPSLALSPFLDKHNLPLLSLSREEALSILSGETPSLQSEQTGWNLASYEGLGLGWVKVLPNRLNNYYPREWRIRMDFRSYEL